MRQARRRDARPSIGQTSRGTHCLSKAAIKTLRMAETGLLCTRCDMNGVAGGIVKGGAIPPATAERRVSPLADVDEGRY